MAMVIIQTEEEVGQAKEEWWEVLQEWGEGVDPLLEGEAIQAEEEREDHRHPAQGEAILVEEDQRGADLLGHLFFPARRTWGVGEVEEEAEDIRRHHLEKSIMQRRRQEDMARNTLGKSIMRKIRIMVLAMGRKNIMELLTKVTMVFLRHHPDKLLQPEAEGLHHHQELREEGMVLAGHSHTGVRNHPPEVQDPQQEGMVPIQGEGVAAAARCPLEQVHLLEGQPRVDKCPQNKSEDNKVRILMDMAWIKLQQDHQDKDRLKVCITFNHSETATFFYWFLSFYYSLYFSIFGLCLIMSRFVMLCSGIWLDNTLGKKNVLTLSITKISGKKEHCKKMMTLSKRFPSECQI